MIIYYIIAINVVAFLSMGVDKFKAVKKMRRIPENTLFIQSLLGGWIGNALAMIVFRHKIRKFMFYLVNIIAFGIWGYLWYIGIITFN